MADTPNPSPLTEEHYQQIRNALDMIAVGEQQIDLARRAGIDVADSEQQVKDAKSKLLQIKNVYFPGR